MITHKQLGLAIFLTLVLLVTIQCGKTVSAPSQEEPVSEEVAAASLPYGLKPGKPYEGTKLTFLLVDAAQYRAIVKRTSEFAELTGIEVEYEFVDFGLMQKKIATEGAAGAGQYDLFTYLDGWGPGFKEFLIPLDNRLVEAGLDMNRYPPAYQQGVTYDGQVYGLPLRGHPQVLFYRQDVFDDLGLEPPETWAELEEAARIISEETDLQGMAMYYGRDNAGQNLFVWLTYLWSNGGDVFAENWKPIFNNAKGVEATQRYVDIMLKDQATPLGSITFSEYDAATSVAQGEAAMVIIWWWQYASITNPEAAAPGVAENISFAPVPGWEDKGTASYAISLPISISAHSKNQEAAWEYLKWVTNQDLEKAYVTDKSDPDTTTIVAVQLANLRDPDVNAISNGMHRVGAESLAVSRILPLIPEWGEVSNVLEIAISEIASGKPTKDVLDSAAVEVEQIMADAGYYQ